MHRIIGQRKNKVESISSFEGSFQTIVKSSDPHSHPPSYKLRKASLHRKVENKGSGERLEYLFGGDSRGYLR